MNFLKSIGHFFTSLFGNNGSTVAKVLHGVSNFVNLAEPIVSELASLSSGFSSSTALIQAIQKWLPLYMTDAKAIAAWSASQDGKSTSEILHSAATTALSAFLPPGALQSDINLAIELAYSIYKKSIQTPIAMTATVGK
jgi:hypothetical protein